MANDALRQAWPETVRSAIKTGADRENVAVYPYRSLCPRSLWRDLITSAERELDGRFSDRHIASSVFLFDDQALVSVHLADLLGHDSPTLHLRRRGADGLYDRFAAHAGYLWDNARDITPR